MSGDIAAFELLGTIYASERDAIIGLVDILQAEESAAGRAIAGWVAVCEEPSLRGGLRMFAERESYHGRVFADRMQALGVQCRAKIGAERGAEYQACLANPAISDLVKLGRLSDAVGDVETLIAPVRDFALRITEDLETKEALLLYCEDEISSGRWLYAMCARFGLPTGTMTAHAA